jgi:adenylylsulfate kinase
VIAMTAFISPYRADRNKARELLESGRFVEIYCQCALEECENRDPKGLYKKARAGEIKQFTGIDAPYEAPEDPEIIIQTDKLSLESSADQVIDYLTHNKII